jgi:hypothetical protein
MRQFRSIVLAGLVVVAFPFAASADTTYQSGPSKFRLVEASIDGAEGIVVFDVWSQPFTSRQASAWRTALSLPSKATKSLNTFQFDCSDNSFRQYFQIIYNGAKELRRVTTPTLYVNAEPGSVILAFGRSACDATGFSADFDPSLEPADPPIAPVSTKAPATTLAPSTTKAPVSTTAAPAKGTVLNPVPFGEYFQLSGWRVRVAQIRDDATVDVALALGSPVAPGGQRWLGVVVEAVRTGSEPQSTRYGLTVSMVRDGRVIPSQSMYFSNSANDLDVAQGTSVLFARFFAVGADLGDFNVSILDDGEYPKSIGVFRSR